MICKGGGITDPESGKSTRRLAKTPATGNKMSKSDSPDYSSKEIVAAQAKFSSNVGALLFLARCTMPTIAYAVGVLGRFTKFSGPAHWAEMNHLLQHIFTVRTMGLRYSNDDPDSVIMTEHLMNWNMYSEDGFFVAYTDSDFAGCPDTSRSTSGYIITWMGAAISWSSSLQACVTLSAAEAELVALTKGAQDVIWTRRLMTQMGHDCSQTSSKIYCDNVATLSLLKNRQFHARTKHIELRNNFTREQTDKGELNPVYIATQYNLADCFTKPVKLQVFEFHFYPITGMKLVYSR